MAASIITNLNVNTLHTLYFNVLSSITANNGILRLLSKKNDEFNPSGFSPNLREAYYGCTNKNWCKMDNNTTNYPKFTPQYDVAPPSLIGYMDMTRYQRPGYFTFFGYIPFSFNINFYDDDKHDGIRVTQYDYFIDYKILKRAANDVLYDIGQKVLNPTTSDETAIGHIFYHPEPPTADDVFFNKNYVLINGDLVLIPICGKDYPKYCFTSESTCQQYFQSTNYIKGDIQKLVNTFADGMNAWYSNNRTNYNGHDYVDLGLPSGNVWSKYNIGSDTFEDLGYRFMWGYTEDCSAYNCNFDDYTKFGNFDIDDTINHGFNKYNNIDRLSSLDTIDDAAHIIMGGDWYIPTKGDIAELLNNTNQRFTTYNGRYCLELQSKINGNQLYIIPNGYIYNRSIVDNQSVWLWSKNNVQANNALAHGMMCTNDNGKVFYENVENFRCWGMFCRAVARKR